MNVYWKYRIPALKGENEIDIVAVLNHGYVRKISVSSRNSEPEVIRDVDINDLSLEYPYLIFNFLKRILLKKSEHLTEQLSFSNPYFLLKILQDYFTILEIMKQIKLLAVQYNDKALYQTTTLFFRENAFNEKILRRLSAFIMNPKPDLLNSILTIKDIFFLYDLIMGYDKEKEKEGRVYLIVNDFIFKHFHKKKILLSCHYYDKDFPMDTFPEIISVPDYREKLLNDLKSCLHTIKHDLEILSGKEDSEPPVNTLKSHVNDAGSDITTSFCYGRIIREDNHAYYTEYLYDRYLGVPDLFNGMHHQALEFVFSLMNFTLIEKRYS